MCHDHQYRPRCGRTIDIDMVLCSSPGPDVTMVPSGNAGPRPSTWLQMVAHTLGSTHSSVVSGATDINIDPVCGRTTDPDMSFSHSPGIDKTMAPVDRSPNSAFPQWQQSPWIPTWSQPTVQTLGIPVAHGDNMGQGHQCRTHPQLDHGPKHDPRIHGSILGQDVTMVPGC